MPINAPSLATLFSQFFDSTTQLLSGIGLIIFKPVGDQIMAVVDDRINQLETAVNSEELRIQQGVSDLNAQIKALKDEIATQNVSPESLAKFDTIIAKVNAFDPTKPDVLPPAPTPEPVPIPTPEPVPPVPPEPTP